MSVTHEEPFWPHLFCEVLDALACYLLSFGTGQAIPQLHAVGLQDLWPAGLRPHYERHERQTYLLQEHIQPL